MNYDIFTYLFITYIYIYMCVYLERVFRGLLLNAFQGWDREMFGSRVWENHLPLVHATRAWSIEVR